ncbi:TetR family transcriptional regulator [Nonomuraea cavernae]|uniref:Transcriptional regulator, TetR family protein n=1 Tax=Nonomuraea cavernae TaxID=2045107 RepID=A0A918DM95_9ACTN|nr:TetR family transcriptional regulator [Nonomuraea cavernae]MCA2188097.1 TetR family transcriptional regulator [Nonomuraea cavernae]GGO72773.1 putative transcriptional regulator, TetR family protein [Nonomuraea cavernae]
MPRIAEVRAPAEPSSPEQRARHVRILRAAAHIGADKGLDRVQMQEVAKAAGVAIATLYRYFPSKTHLFTAVMAEHVDRFGDTVGAPKPGTGPEDTVGDVLVSASRQFLRRPALALAMLTSANVANAAAVADAGRIDASFRQIVLRSLGIDDPTVMDITLVRLLMQCWYGVLQSTLNGRMSIPDAESDIRIACRLLLASRSNAAPPSR